MSANGTIVMFVGLIITVAAISKQEYVFLAGSVPLLTVGLWMMYESIKVANGRKDE